MSQVAVELGAAAPVDPVDPLRPAAGGVYEDAFVTVRCVPVAGRVAVPHPVGTTHFQLGWLGGRIVVQHAYGLDQLDDDLAGVIADELFQQGWVQGSDLFERIFTGVVLTTASDPLVAWEAFYRNTIRAIEIVEPDPRATAHGSIAGYAPVYARGLELMEGEVALELGACFGFFSLQLAAAGHRVVANDVSEGTVRLLHEVGRRLGASLTCVAADAARVPLPDDCVDTVFALHLLEHLPPDHGDEVVAEAVRLARRRVVVAVPYEEEPDPAFGHVRTLTAASLSDIGQRSGHRWVQTDDHGGWLVIDVASGPVRDDLSEA